ncbi:MAG: PA0069 family radical SAM protein [Pseudomonadota bacterium]|nr:PA0069 family radical SAM protein [Pseudomonadota bacterium]
MTQDHESKCPVLRGRGSNLNPAGRYETEARSVDGEYLDILAQEENLEDGIQVETRIHRDTSRSVISTNDSPDVGMEATLNPYRGCEHGCIYCYARPTHEYLGLSAGVDFESRIFVKEDAARLLEHELASKSWMPKVITLSGVTDAYQPLEKKLSITRSCLEVLRDFRNPAAIITKNALVLRDADIFQDMAAWNGICVNISVTTLDRELARKMEPRASQPALRLKAIETLAGKGIPVNVMVGPVLPGLTDHEIPAILKSVADAGANSAYYTMLRLPYGVKDLFTRWMEDNYPQRAAKVLGHVRDVRDGKLNNSDFGSRMRGTGAHADKVANLFRMFRKRHGLDRPFPSLSTHHFRRNTRSPQGDLFS